MLVGAILGSTMLAGFSLTLPAVASADVTTLMTSVVTPGASGGVPSSPQCNADMMTRARQRIIIELAGRITQLHILTVRVNDADTLVSSDKATLVSDLTQTELPGIQALQTKVPGDTTCVQLRQDARSMVYDFRVYVVMTPQTDLVLATDALIHAEAVFADIETVASQRIESGVQGKGGAAAQSALADYGQNVSAAQALTAGQSTTLLAQSPQGYPGNRSAFLQARTDLSNARDDLRTARRDLADIIGDLR